MRRIDTIAFNHYWDYRPYLFRFCDLVRNSDEQIMEEMI